MRVRNQLKPTTSQHVFFFTCLFSFGRTIGRDPTPAPVISDRYPLANCNGDADENDTTQCFVHSHNTRHNRHVMSVVRVNLERLHCKNTILNCLQVRA